jgi:hypothetical protein
MMADWLATEPEVPEGQWFKRFPAMTVYGEVSGSKPFLKSARPQLVKN